MELTSEIVQKVLAVVDKGLSSGLGKPIPGNMCVEAAVCYALGLPHSDDPQCVSKALRRFKIVLNDACWSSKTARAFGMRRLAVLQLGTITGFEDEVFSEKLTIKTVNTVLASIFSDIGLTSQAKELSLVVNLKQATEAAWAAEAAAEAAEAAEAAASAAWAAEAAASAAWAARAARTAEAAARAARAARTIPDKYLNLLSKIASDILIEMDVPAVKFLSLLGD